MNEGLSISSYKQMMKKRMGESKFLQIFNHAEAITTKTTAIKSYEETVKSWDDQIKQNEEVKRQDQIREEKILAEQKAKEEKEAKEREAKESAMKLMRPLTDEEQHIVDSAIHGIGPVAEILVRQDADSVQRGSMQTLQPNTWLNDEIINYFLKNCLAKRDEKLCAKQPGRKRSHFFNSFFVQTMFDEKNLNPSLRGKYNYKNVKRWGKKVPGKDVFNLRYIVCPINLDNMHWTSAVIFMELKKIQYFDSMGGTDRSKLEGLLQYLKDEHKAKKGTELDVSEWELVPCTMDTPRQRNGKLGCCG
jgi:sentrin-specific protease 1